MLAPTESTAIAKALLFRYAIREQGVGPGELHIHADGGAMMMKAKSLALLFADLGISKSHSRPHTSNDNPYSEAQFKTLKYRPELPPFFASLRDTRLFIADFVHWYNHEHRHSGLAFLTPADVHFGRVHDARAQRNAPMLLASQKHPERFRPTGPAIRALPSAVYINKPDDPAHESETIAPIDAQSILDKRVRYDKIAH